MAELQIYDSQGRPIRDGAGRESKQIKDFFFDGVRFAVDSNRNEIFCFFRARDNDTARSEQYYAKYTYQARSEMRDIYQEVKTRIEGEYGMILDTENDDTRFFELLGSSESGRVPNSSDIDDVATLLSKYDSARIGVGSYSEAFGLFGELFSNNGVSKIAVSDNATGRSLSAYDLVIEKGDHFGVELLGDTEEKVESLREQRRSAFESEYGTDDDNDPISGLIGAALFAGIGVAIILAVLYGSCLGLNMALIGDLPGDTCGPSLGDVNADVAGNGSQEIQISGVIDGKSNTNATVNVTVRKENETELLRSSGNRQLNSSGNFNFTVQPDSNVASLSPGNYTATVEFRGGKENASFTVNNDSVATAQTPESDTTTPTPESDTTTPTPESDTTTSTPESSDTSTASGAENASSASGDETTTAASIDSIDAQETVDGQTDSFRISGATTGLEGRNISISVDFSSTADGPLVNIGGERNVRVAPNGTFGLDVFFSPEDTMGPYNVTVSYNGSSATDTFESADSAEPKLGGLTVSTPVDAQNAKLSFEGTTSNIDWGANPTMEVGIDHNTSPIYNESVEVETKNDGTFQKIGLKVSDNALQEGNYTLYVTYDGMEVEDTFSVSTSN